MGGFTVVVLLVIAAAISGIILVAALGMPVTFAGAISALGVGAVTAIVRFWPEWKE